MNKKLPLAAIALGLALLHAAYFLSPWGESLERKFLSLWFNLRGPVAPPPDIVIVTMDEESYQELGFSLNQPWPRSTHAELLRRLAEAGAKEMVFDVVFLGQSSDPLADQKLSEAIGKLPTVLGADFGVLGEDSYRREGLLLPEASLSAQARAVGLVAMPEEEGYISRFFTQRTDLTRGLPSLAEAAANKKPASVGLPRARDFLNYYGPPRTIRTLSYYQALETEPPLPAEVFRNKTVFVGLSLRTGLGPAQKDTAMTPFSSHGRMAGVEIQATAAANLLAAEWIRRARLEVEVVILSLWAAAMAAVLFRSRPQWGAVVLLGNLLGWMGIAYTSFLARRFVPGAALATVILPLSFLGSTLYYYVVTRRQQRQLERAFQYYLSPQMARQVASDPRALKLGGEAVVATALFTDIEGFTSTVESMQPQDVARMLNTYFTEVMDSIFENEGTLIKFIGDAVFALWGAPLQTPDHARLACAAALSIGREIVRFNAAKRFPPLRTRIGIHTGPMVVGNLGSARRFDFTAIGDSVNLASRVEGLNKYFGTDILITDSVRAEIGTTFPSLKLGSIRAVGKKRVVVLYALFLEPIAGNIEKQWMDALAQFSARQWDAAGHSFAILSGREPRLRKAAALYLDQIQQHRHAAPSDDWQGEIVFSAK